MYGEQLSIKEVDDFVFERVSSEIASVALCDLVVFEGQE